MTHPIADDLPSRTGLAIVVHCHHEGVVEVSVTAKREIVQFRVRDTGIGIAPEMLPRIFDIFMQVHPNTAGGLGIWLTLVRRLVELCGGTVTASSAGANRGSEFLVELPTRR